MFQRKIKKLITVICSIIIVFSSFSVCAAEPEDVVFYDSDITSLFSSSEFEIYNGDSVVSPFISHPSYSFYLYPNLSNLKFNFNFNFSSFFISKYCSYRFSIPLVLSLVSSRFSINDISIYLKIVYSDGSVSSFIVSPISISVDSSDSTFYYLPFDFSISGNKLLNISDCYFDLYFNSPSRGGCQCYLGLEKDSVFTISKFYPDYNTFFNSSLNWVSNIFEFVSDNFSLFVLCIGFPIVVFGFVLLKRILRN